MSERQSQKKVTFSDSKADSPPNRLFPERKPDGNSEQQVAENYSLLTKKVDRIGDNVELILRKQEKDFMSAFRAHMFQVKKELVKLKEKVDDAEMKMMRDEKILSLEKSINRVQDDALYMESLKNNYQKEAETWKSKAEELEGERDFLQKQAVLLMRQLGQLSQPAELSLPQLRSSPSPSKGPLESFKPKSDFGRWLEEIAKKHSVASAPMLLEIETHAIAIQSHFESALAHMKRTLADCKKQIRGLQSNASTIASERSELEGLFLDCVKEVKRDISARRGTAEAGVKLENRDKGKVMELLFSNDRLLGFLYEKMFRSSGNGFSGRSSMMADRHISANQSEEMILKELAGVPIETEEVKDSRRSKSSASSKARKRKDIVVVDGKLMLAK